MNNMGWMTLLLLHSQTYGLTNIFSLSQQQLSNHRDWKFIIHYESSLTGPHQLWGKKRHTICTRTRQCCI